MFSRFPDYLLIIKLYFSYFSNLWNTRKHINQHTPQGSGLSLKPPLSCWDVGSPTPDSPSGPRVLFPSSLRLSLDSDSLFPFLFSSLTPLPREHTHMPSKGRACLRNLGLDTHPLKEKETFRALLLLKAVWFTTHFEMRPYVRIWWGRWGNGPLAPTPLRPWPGTGDICL